MQELVLEVVDTCAMSSASHGTTATAATIGDLLSYKACASV